jgi:hypothetical protein
MDGHGNVSIFYMMKPRIFLSLSLLLLLGMTIASACSPQSAPTPFRPPTEAGPTAILPTTTPVPQIYTAVPTPTITLTVPAACTNDLKFLEDVTVPDDTSVAPGASIDKQWLVQNTGTCSWDETYHLIWIGGDPLGASQEQPLYPARAGAQATLRIVFTAPTTEGPYESAWQAFDSTGIAFGDPVYIKISVSP